MAGSVGLAARAELHKAGVCCRADGRKAWCGATVAGGCSFEAVAQDLAMPLPRHTDLSHHEVFETLTQSRAQLLRGASLGDGLGVAMWRNGKDAPTYQAPGHHTLSLYLSGGHDTYRTDAPSLRGAPGRLCVMPAGHEAQWVVGGEQRFVHLYFEPRQLAPLALRILEREPREVALPELTFVDDPALAHTMGRLAALDWSDPQSRLQANELGHEALAQLLMAHHRRAVGGTARGGLSPAVRRRLVEWLDARLAQPVTIGEMAGQAALSEHHFARMFRESFGIAPHAWVLARRIERARQLLRTSSLPLAHIAHDCGFATASHLVNRFRAQLGATPGQYRQAVCGGR
jgi:AraC family transcriptional regulator